jgi:CTP:molybdopterin cytidylyltransferase MocA
MLLAIILADNITPVQGQPSYLLPLGNESVIERTAGTVLCGPFGGVIVASAPQFAPQIRERLQGFAVQQLQLKGLNKGPHSALIESLNFAEGVRQRWEKAMAAAASRFAASDENEDDSDDSDDDEVEEDREDIQPPQPAKTSAPARHDIKTHGRRDWSPHRKSADIKVRGLARSFDRDGIMIFRGERPGFRPELQAQLAEAFGREGAEKGSAARGFAQAVFEGQRGYPITMTVDAAREVSALPPETLFDDWLLANLRRVQDVNVDDAGALSGIYSDTDYTELLGRFRR